MTVRKHLTIIYLDGTKADIGDQANIEHAITIPANGDMRNQIEEFLINPYTGKRRIINGLHETIKETDPKFPPYTIKQLADEISKRNLE